MRHRYRRLPMDYLEQIRKEAVPIRMGAEAYLEKLDGLKKRQEKLKQEISGQSVILFH